MFREYALEPAALSSWEQFRFFLSQIGPWRGRFIAQYPKHWKRMVYDALACADVARSRIEARLATLDARVFSSRPGAPYDGSRSWLRNALDEHARRPFHAIIAASVDAAAGAIDAAEINDDHPAWKLDQGDLIARDPVAFAVALRLLLAQSRRIAIIDPYFRGDQRDKRAPLTEFCIHVPSSSAVEIHASTIHVADDFFRQVAQQHLPADLPSGRGVTLHTWQQRPRGPRLHNRYLLTEIGGVQFGDGVETGNPGETDRISILEEATRAELWAQYVEPGNAFDRIGVAITVTGTGGRRR
jgi:hypothetical protein